MSTHVDLAAANTTGKVFSIPFTFADANAADYASGLPAFTPAVGDVILAVWAMSSVAFDEGSQVGVTNADSSVVLDFDPQAASANTGGTRIKTGQDTELRVWLDGNTPYTTGVGVLKVYVLPGS